MVDYARAPRFEDEQQYGVIWYKSIRQSPFFVQMWEEPAAVL